MGGDFTKGICGKRVCALCKGLDVKGKLLHSPIYICVLEPRTRAGFFALMLLQQIKEVCIGAREALMGSLSLAFGRDSPIASSASARHPHDH